MLHFISRPMVRIVERYLPDPLVFVFVLTLVAGLAAVLSQGSSPLDVVAMWGDGFWSLLTFSMQMLLVLVTGYMMASTPLVRRGLQALAGMAKTPGGAILLVSFMSLTASWINWGFGLVVATLGPIWCSPSGRCQSLGYRG